MDESIEVTQLLKKAREVLDSVNLNWSNQSTALAGLGYALLALAAAIKENHGNEGQTK
jgi:hypothetical protein